MDDLIIESTGNLEHYTNVDDLNVDNPDPVEAVPDSTYYVYQPVPEEVQEYKEDVQGEYLKEKDQTEEEDKEEEKEEEEEEEDVKEVQYVYIKSDSVLDGNDINNRNSAETVSVNEIQYLIDTPLNEYKLTDSLITIIIFMGLFVGMIYCIKRTVFKWN